jgi:hypothetical protein
MQFANAPIGRTTEYRADVLTKRGFGDKLHQEPFYE